jgi:parallel beta-helix repeat protein
MIKRILFALLLLQAIAASAALPAPAVGVFPTNSPTDGYTIIATGSKSYWGPATGGGGGAATNFFDSTFSIWDTIGGSNRVSIIGLQPASANLTNWSALATSAKQDHSANLDLWSAVVPSAFQPASPNLTNWSAYAAVDPNTKQPASANLTNWSAIATGSKENQSANLDLWSALSPSAYQPASANLTNWSALATSAKQDALGFTPQIHALALDTLTNGDGSALTNTSSMGGGTNSFASKKEAAAIAAAVAGGGTTIHSLYDVKNYSAVGDGSTDDTAAFTNAVYAASQAGGGIVYMPQGHYKTTATINVSNAPIWFIGAGAATKIEPSGNFDVFKFYGNSRGSGAARFFVSGTNQTGGNIFTVTNAHRITFKDITAEAPWQMFSIESCNTCTIDNVWADGVKGSWFCKWFGDDANRSDVLQFNNVTASGGTTNTDGIIWDGNCNSMDMNNVGLVTMNYGIHILKSAGANSPAFLFAHGLQIDFPNREAVKIETGQRFNFIDSYMHGSILEYGVFATNGVDQVTIQGGNITGHKKGGIHLQSTGSKVIGVEIYNNSQAGTGTYPGILMTNGAIAQIVGNRISSNHQYGLRVESATRPVVVGNDMSGNVSGDFFDVGHTMITESEATQRPFFTDTNTYLSGRASAISTLTVSVNKLYMLPVWVTEVRQFNLMTLGFVSTGSVGFVHLGLYGSDRTTGHPTTLILDCHELVTTTTGTKITNCVVTLNPGMYHLACEFSSTPTVHAILSDELGVLMNNGVSDVGGLSRTFSYGALPTDESAQTYNVETTFMPAVGIR